MQGSGALALQRVDQEVQMKMVHLIVCGAERSKLAAVLPDSALDSEDMSPRGFHSGGNCRTETIP